MAEDRVQDYTLKPIGLVRSPVEEGNKMPIEGVPATVEVFPAYAGGLKGIDSNTHLIILGWFHQAQRDVLFLEGRGNRPRGVFGLRSPGRPNPIGLCSARVTQVEGLRVHLDRLDMIDGTPIADIKRYSPGWDSIFSARTSRDLDYPGGRDPAAFLRDMLVEAINFHGETCTGAALGARMMGHAIHTWKIGKKDPDLSIAWGPDGCIDDALQAISGATIGNGRLRPGVGTEYTLSHHDRALAFWPKGHPPDTAADILDGDIHTLFDIR